MCVCSTRITWKQSNYNMKNQFVYVTCTCIHLTRVHSDCSCFWGHRKFRIFLLACQDSLLRGYNRIYHRSTENRWGVFLSIPPCIRLSSGSSVPGGTGKSEEGSWRETLVLLGIVRRHRGGWVCGPANTMRWIFLVINLSGSVFLGICAINTELLSWFVELFCKDIFFYKSCSKL